MKGYLFVVESGGRAIELSAQMPETLDEAILTYGSQSVLNTFNAGKKSSEKGYVRHLLADAKNTDEIIAEKLANWKPGVTNRGKSPEDKALEAFMALSPEQQAKVKAALAD